MSEEQGAYFGMPAAKWFKQMADKEQPIAVSLVTGKTLVGRVVGYGRYEFEIEQTSGLRIFITKGAVAYVCPNKSNDEGKAKDDG